MTTTLGFVVPGVIGTICLLTVCSVYLWKQSFKLDGLLLSICGVVLLGLSTWQVRSGEQALSDLPRQLGEIRDTWAGLEAQIAEIAKNQRQLTTLLGALKEAHASASKARQAEPQTAADVPEALPPDSLEIEAIGGVSGEELDAIVSWIQDIKSERPTSVILIEPVMPHESADSDGQRKKLMNEAGRVMDHVFDAIGQRIEVTRLSSDNVPGPRLRLHLEASSVWHRDGFGATSEDRRSSLPSPSPIAAETGRKTISDSSQPTHPTPASLGAPASREANQDADQGLEPQSKAEWGQEGSVAITFAINSSYFPPGTSDALNSLVDRMANGARYRVQLQVGLGGSDKVAGATNPEEAMRYNKWLAERRMNRVKEWLTVNARDRQLEIESEFLADDSSRRVVVRAMPTSS
jgi:outer membrane protein OmpA-like peptidoglycan-associated protein